MLRFLPFIIHCLVVTSGSTTCTTDYVTMSTVHVLRRADCSNRILWSVPTGLPSSIQVLDLAGNHIKDLRDSLGRYPKLHILNVSCNAISELTATNFKNLSSLRELYLTGMYSLIHIRHDTFRHLDHLKVLNLACNRRLEFLPVMTALSNAPFVLDDLVIDALVHTPTLNTINSETFNSSSLQKLKRLTLKFNHIVGFDPHVLRHITSVEYLSIAYNSPFGFKSQDNTTGYTDVFLFLNKTQLISLDFSHLFDSQRALEYCWCCSCVEVSSYFQFPRYPVDAINPYQYHLDHIGYHPANNTTAPSFNFLPQSLRYVYANDIRSLAKGRIFDGMQVNKNNIQYFNVSGSPLGGFYGTVLGFDNLEVLDISWCQISVLPDGFMAHFPRLRVLLMVGNRIPTIIKTLGNSGLLEILDLSSNHIDHIPRHAFQGYVKLKILDLSNNMLQKVDFIISGLRSLSNLDLSSNNIQAFGDDFISQLYGLRNVIDFNISLSGNAFVCSCHSVPFVEWIHQSLAVEQVTSRDRLDCLYGNRTDYPIAEVDIDVVRESCREKIKIVDNIIKTVLAPVMTVILMCGLGALLCYRLRWQIWWEWHIIIRKKAGNDQQEFTHDIFIACEDSRKSGEFVTRLQENNTEYIHSSKDLDLNKSELEQNGQMMDISRRILFFVDDNLIDNLRQWEFLMPPVIESRRLDNIGLVIDTGLLETSLREYYPLWRLSKSTQCFGFYSGQDTNMTVWRDIAEFVRPVNDSYNGRLNEQDYSNMFYGVNDSDPLELDPLSH